MQLASCHPSGALNFEVGPRLKKKNVGPWYKRKMRNVFKVLQARACKYRNLKNLDKKSMNPAGNPTECVRKFNDSFL